MTLTIPGGLKPVQANVHPVFPSRDGGLTLGGRPLIVSAPDAYWIARLTYVVPQDLALEWRGFLAALGGSGGTFAYTFFDREKIPPKTPMMLVDGATTLTLKDGATTLSLVAGARIATAAPAYARAVTIRHPGAGLKWTAGMVFNIGSHTYMVGQIVSKSADTVSARIAPPLRAPVTPASVLGDPVLTLRLQNPDQAWAAIESGPASYTLDGVDVF